MIKRSGPSIITLVLALAASGLARAQGEAQKDLPGPIDSLQDLQDSGKMLFKLADENNDGQISQKEAVDAANLTVGGFFFRADANGDAVLSQDEARAAKESFLKDRPWIRYVVETAKTTRSQDGQSNNNDRADAIQALLSAVDTNNDKQLQATELRQTVQTTVQGLFAAADTDRNGQLSPTEVNAAMAGAAKAAAQAVFQEADTDNNGSLNQAEFDKAILKPAHVMFAVMDLNHDGQITREEAQRARRGVMEQLRKLSMPEAPNSPRHLLQSGQKPSDVAPVPNIDPRNVIRPAQSNPAAASGTPAPPR